MQPQGDNGNQRARSGPLVTAIKPQIDIRNATIRDVSYVAMHMRKRDADEIWCQRSHRSAPTLAHECVKTSLRYGYCAYVSDEPVAAFGVGFVPGIPWVGHLWAYGTRRMPRAIRTITDHFRYRVGPELMADRDVLRVECRSLSTYAPAHRWIRAFGLKECCELYAFGKNGEDFKLFALTRGELPQQGTADVRRSEDSSRHDGSPA